MTNIIDREWYRKIPKVELHLHLEGAIPIETLWVLIQKYGRDISVSNVDQLRKKFIYRNFTQFVDSWMWKNQFLREYEDFTLISEAIARSLATQRVRYAEIFYSPSSFVNGGLKTQLITESINKGFNKVPDVKVGLICDLVRDYGPKTEWNRLDELAEVKGFNVLGIGIGGSEDKFPPEPFEALFNKARELGFHTNAHAGEAASSKSIWGAINTLKVERIGHGVRAQDDPRLIEYLKVHKIPLEMCPLSNLKTGVIESSEKHPIRRFFDNDLMVTINTDDPLMFNNTLADEFEFLVSEHNFTKTEIMTLILNGVQASWLALEQKMKLREEIIGDLLWCNNDDL